MPHCITISQRILDSARKLKGPFCQPVAPHCPPHPYQGRENARGGRGVTFSVYLYFHLAPNQLGCRISEHCLVDAAEARLCHDGIYHLHIIVTDRRNGDVEGENGKSFFFFFSFLTQGTK